jgi:16S rRNA (guanine527-N7)-methyltransferase
MTAGERLDRGLVALNLGLPADTRRRLIDYLGLIQKWNQVYNLTAVRDPPSMVGQHLLDSLAVLPHVGGRRILDVGSGAGLPGIPLALALPDAHVTLLDANEKKAAFLRQASIELGLANAEVVCERVETWHPDRNFDLVIARAFSKLPEFVAVAGVLAGTGGRLAAMKGVYPHDELSRIPAGYRVRDVIALKVPYVRAERHLVLVEPA